MIAIKRGCLDHDELHQVLAGQMPAEDFDSAISHLDNCDHCRSAADAIAQDGRWLIETLGGDKPDPLQTLVTEMLSRDPSKRTSTAEDVANRLADFGKDSRLKGLLREALRRRANDDSIQPSLLPSLSAGAIQPPKNRYRKWLAGGMFGALLVLVAIIFKIQTDKGNLVVHSDHDGLTIVITQDDEVVDRLTITKSKDNRTLLRKGTYRVQIEGGGEALALSDEVVTIGRGVDAPIRVTEKPPKNPSAQQLDPNTVVESESDDGLLFEGKPLAHWLRLLSREQDPSALGKVMQAVEALTQSGGDRTAAAAASLKIARRWGGIVIDGPVGLGNQFHTESDRSHVYMYFLNEIFPGYMPEPGITVIASELEEGNARSRIASLMLLNSSSTHHSLLKAFIFQLHQQFNDFK